MKLTVVLLGCMLALAAAVPLAVGAWGLWSVPAVTLTVAVVCLDGAIWVVLSQRARRLANVTRFGVPLRHHHFPIHEGPLPGVPQRRSSPAAGHGAEHDADAPSSRVG